MKACPLLFTAVVFVCTALSLGSDLHLTDHDTLESHGLTILLYHNPYHHVFGDQKMNGMEMIL